jgi:mRNA deadenylase 3'-5' endonuclease subunit Ccr4
MGSKYPNFYNRAKRVALSHPVDDKESAKFDTFLEERDGLVIVTYNILADAYAYPKYFPWCVEHEKEPKQRKGSVLSWPVRRTKILQELLSYSPDIILLQV